jgi:hypothetical protein
MIEFTSTLLKPAGVLKPGGRGCDISPTGIAVGGFGRVPRVWPWVDFYQTYPIAIPTYGAGIKKVTNLALGPFGSLHGIGCIISGQPS